MRTGSIVFSHNAPTGLPFKPRLARKRDNPEGKLVLTIIKELRWRGFYAAKLKVKGGLKQGGGFIKDLYACVGLPDLIAFTPKLAFIECKSKVGVQSPHQKAFQALCKASGTPYILARSIEDVLSALKLS